MADISYSSLSGVPKGTTANRPASPSLGDVYYNGSLGIMEIYTSAGWSALAGIAPDSPVSVSAADIGTSVAFGTGSADVSFTAGGGGPSTSFIVTPTPTTSPPSWVPSSVTTWGSVFVIGVRWWNIGPGGGWGATRWHYWRLGLSGIRSLHPGSGRCST